MYKKIKSEYFDLALETGGSHYPGVGGALLSTFGDLIVQECIKIALANGNTTTVKQLEQRFGITNGVQL
jgi:hypothetical protein